jgi:hypothetical protein
VANEPNSDARAEDDRDGKVCFVDDDDDVIDICLPLPRCSFKSQITAGRPLFTSRRTTASPKPDAPPVTKNAF